jgi:hypothetical protein
VIGGARDSESEALVFHLIIPGSFAIGMQQDMGMPFDKAGHEGERSKIDDGRSWGGHPGGRADAIDPITFHKNGPTLLKLVSIKDASRLQEKRPSSLSLAVNRSERYATAEKKKPGPDFHHVIIEISCQERTLKACSTEQMSVPVRTPDWAKDRLQLAFRFTDANSSLQR